MHCEDNCVRNWLRSWLNCSPCICYRNLWNYGFREITDFEISDFVKSSLNSWNGWIGELGLRLATNNAKPNFYFGHFTHLLVISRNPWFHRSTVTYTHAGFVHAAVHGSADWSAGDCHSASSTRRRSHHNYQGKLFAFTPVLPSFRAFLIIRHLRRPFTCSEAFSVWWDRQFAVGPKPQFITVLPNILVYLDLLLLCRWQNFQS